MVFLKVVRFKKKNADLRFIRADGRFYKEWLDAAGPRLAQDS